MNNVTDRFASALDRRDQGPNEAIAEEIARGATPDLLRDVTKVLESKANTRLKNDAVMVMMALSRIAPHFLEDHFDLLMKVLRSSSNRQVFGSMIALANLAPLKRRELRGHIPMILKAMDQGTVVTRDHGFTILTELYKEDQSGDLLSLINEQILKAPPNQLGQYTEKFMIVVRPGDIPALIEALEARAGELTNEHHLKRLGKNLKKLQQG